MSPPLELLYWVAILFSNSLGTSSGDYLVDVVGFGFRDSALLLSGIMLALLAAHYFTRLNGMVLFWIAFVLTRPLGATGGDSLSKPGVRSASQAPCAWARTVVFLSAWIRLLSTSF
jgi:uncharacterized membrane-anchored protein